MVERREAADYSDENPLGKLWWKQLTAKAFRFIRNRSKFIHSALIDAEAFYRLQKYARQTEQEASQFNSNDPKKTCVYSP